MLLFAWILYFPVTTSASIQSYKPGPEGRGTIGILNQCLSTLSIAVYTALHLNINPSKSWWKQSVKMFTWILIAMACPEWVIWCAIGQREVAKKICEAGRAIQEVEPLPRYDTNTAGGDVTPVRSPIYNH